MLRMNKGLNKIRICLIVVSFLIMDSGDKIGKELKKPFMEIFTPLGI